MPFRSDDATRDADDDHATHGILARYAEFLPVTAATPRLSLAEGNTPLLSAPRLAEWVGLANLHLKYEGTNPTGSFKDRGMVLAVAKALEAGATTLVCASTGNTSASAAAYAARAGLKAVVLLPAGKVARGKLAQAVVAGATVIMLDCNFDGALSVARDLARRYSVALVNSVNPHRIAGQTTAAFELCDALGDAPDVVALPVGNGGNVTAYAEGFQIYRTKARTTRIPKFIGAQAAGAAPLVQGIPVEHPETIATAIRIGNPASWKSAVDAVALSGGEFKAVSDDAILEAYHRVAELEGVFCEPASAAGIAALRLSVRGGHIATSARAVCVLTGNGLKDPDRAVPGLFNPTAAPADAGALAAALELVPRAADT
ncbi:MAG TPA: threonine synthase [Gemmatimonadaceae bacterium]